MLAGLLDDGVDALLADVLLSVVGGGVPVWSLVILDDDIEGLVEVAEDGFAVLADVSPAALPVIPAAPVPLDVQ